MVLLDWIAAVGTIVSMYLIALRRWQGWLVLIGNSVIWIYLMAEAGYIGLVILEAILLVQGVWGLLTWIKKED